MRDSHYGKDVSLSSKNPLGKKVAAAAGGGLTKCPGPSDKVADHSKEVGTEAKSTEGAEFDLLAEIATKGVVATCEPEFDRTAVTGGGLLTDVVKVTRAPHEHFDIIPEETTILPSPLISCIKVKPRVTLLILGIVIEAMVPLATIDHVKGTKHLSVDPNTIFDAVTADFVSVEITLVKSIVYIGTDVTIYVTEVHALISNREHIDLSVSYVTETTYDNSKKLHEGDTVRCDKTYDV